MTLYTVKTPELDNYLEKHSAILFVAADDINEVRFLTKIRSYRRNILSLIASIQKLVRRKAIFNN